MRSTFRWLIRSLCLLALAAVLAAWVTSYFAPFHLLRVKAGQNRLAGVAQGNCCVRRINDASFGDSPLRLFIQGWAVAKDWLPVSTTRGFYAGPVPGSADSFAIIFPLWLPTLVLLGLNAFVWRKAFRRTPRGAFPIEPTTAPK